MQFAVYRNYDCKADQILQHSGYESNPSQLEKFMTTIEACGGWGTHEAVEIGLLHVNKECLNNDISQVIIIGDAMANTPTEVIKKREYHGDIYWNDTKYGTATNMRKELDAIKQRGIKIHAFHVNDIAKRDFEILANETGGRCERLDINSSNGAIRLTNLITEEILRNAGGEKGNQLVEIYRKRYTS